MDNCHRVLAFFISVFNLEKSFFTIRNVMLYFLSAAGNYKHFLLPLHSRVKAFR